MLNPEPNSVPFIPSQAVSPTAQLRDAGFLVLSNILDNAHCDQVVRSLEQLAAGRAGSRALLGEDWCRELAMRLAGHSEIAPLLPPASRPIQCTLFEKTPENNWLVAFHQDQSMPVGAQTDVDAHSVAHEKDGMKFVQPPVEILQQLLAVRLQIDDPDGSDGALRVIPGSHRHGKLTASDVARLRASNVEVSCQVERGGVLLMRPLLLHASSKIVGRQARRVLHFLFGPGVVAGPAQRSPTPLSAV